MQRVDLRSPRELRLTRSISAFRNAPIDTEIV
jgi:hypothetical protein